MSLRVKLVSAIIAMILMLGVMLTGILAAQQQTLTMTGSVTFNIADKSLYVKQVRIKQDNNSDPQVVSDFLPGYINGEFDMNIGEFTGVNSNTLGSFALYFDIINATDIQWAIKNVTLSEQLQTENVSVSYSGVIEVNELTDTDSDGYKNFDPATKEADGTLILIITAPNSSSINLSGITITLYEYVEETVYERVDAEGNPDPNGTYLLFGWYPQTVKSADVTVGSTPESNGYYLGSDGAYYMKATAQVDSDPSGGTYDNFKDGTSITQGTEYYFKMEKLKWRILTENYEGSGNALIVCDTIVDMVNYQSNYVRRNGYYYATDEDGTILTDPTATVGQGVDSNHQVYANNYEHSEIREYLNSTFYNTAFNAEEKSYIVTTTVDNSLESIFGSYTAESGYTEDTFNIECRDTEDNVFLLSLSDVNNTEYGFKDSYEMKFGGEYDFDTARAFYTSDFSRAMGAATMTETILSQLQSMGVPEEDIPLYLGSGAVWLRSPYDSIHGTYAFFVNIGGYYDYCNVDGVDGGVVPALQIQLG